MISFAFCRSCGRNAGAADAAGPAAGAEAQREAAQVAAARQQHVPSARHTQGTYSEPLWANSYPVMLYIILVLSNAQPDYDDILEEDTRVTVFRGKSDKGKDLNKKYGMETSCAIRC